VRAAGVEAEQVRDMEWVVNGPRWLGVLLDDAASVLSARPDFAAIRALGGVEIGLIGPHAPGGDADYEVRALCSGLAVPEDPATGSLHAGLARWLVGAGIAASSYVATQGTVVGRAGRVTVERQRWRGQDALWVGGQTALRVAGAVDLT